MKDWDPTGKQGPKIPLPDVVTVHTPKEEDAPVRDDKKGKDKEGLQVSFAPLLLLLPSPTYMPDLHLLTASMHL